MAGIKISGLPATTTPGLVDLIPIVQAGVTERTSFNEVLELFLDNLNSGTGLTDGQLLIGSTGITPVASTLTAGTNIAITNTAGSITIDGTGDAGFSWSTVTETTQSMISNNGYTANNAALVTFTLPATAAVGEKLSIIGLGAGGWIIAQNASQEIQVQSSVSTSGTGGSVASTNRYDSINLRCTIADTRWAACGAPEGTLTVV